MFTKAPAAMGDAKSTLNAKKIVIIGDGPVGLAQAIALKNRGLDVTIVGPRLGQYTRSGDFRPNVVTREINDLIFPEKIGDTPGRHLKDLERQLYAIAQKLNITLIKQEFSGFVSHNTIEIREKNDNNKKSLLAADLVYDCTGTARVALNKVNDIRPGTFKFSVLPGNPHKSYASVRAIMTPAEIGMITDFYEFDYVNENSVLYALSMEELREMGWSGFNIPFIYCNRFPKKLRDPADPENSQTFTTDPYQKKVNIYLQIPSSMVDRQDIEKFVQILMRLGRGDWGDMTLPTLTVHDESKKPGKHMVARYDINPTQVWPGFYLGDKQMPPILHAGDATADMPFYHGGGVMHGVSRCNLLNNELIIKDGMLKGVREADYNQILSACLRKQKREILRSFSSHRDLIQVNSIALELYTDAYYNGRDLDERIKILRGLAVLNPRFCFEHLQAIRKSLTELKIQSDPLSCDSASEYLESVVELIRLAQADRSCLASGEHELLDELTRICAEQCKKLANIYVEAVSHAKAIKFYQLGLDVLAGTMVPFVKDIEALYLNLIIVQRNDVAQVLMLARKVESEYFPLLVAGEKDSNDNKVVSTVDKIAYRKTIALLETVELQLKNPAHRSEHVGQLTREIEQTIARLTYKADLEARYAALKDKFKEYFEERRVLLSRLLRT
jgi:hypothetical protein